MSGSVATTLYFRQWKCEKWATNWTELHQTAWWRRSFCVKRFMSSQSLHCFLYGCVSRVSAVLWCCLLSFLAPRHSFRVGAVWPSPSSHCYYGQQLHRSVCRGDIAGHRFSVSWLASSSGCGHFAAAPAAFLLVVSHMTICEMCCSNVSEAVRPFTVHRTVCDLDFPAGFKLTLEFKCNHLNKENPTFSKNYAVSWGIYSCQSNKNKRL